MSREGGGKEGRYQPLLSLLSSPEECSARPEPLAPAPTPQLSECRAQEWLPHSRGSLAKYRNDSVSGRLPRALRRLRPGVGEGEGEETGSLPSSPAPAPHSGRGRHRRGCRAVSATGPHTDGSAWVSGAPWLLGAAWAGTRARHSGRRLWLRSPRPRTLPCSSRCSCCIHHWAIQGTQGGCGVGLSLSRGRVGMGAQSLVSTPSTELPIAGAARRHRPGLACAQPGSGDATSLAQRCPEVKAQRCDKEGSMQQRFFCLQWLLTSLLLPGGHHLSQHTEGAALGAPVP